ncbi:MAG: hypothetical protein ABW275_03690 [Hansschlegelia sp.]
MRHDSSAARTAVLTRRRMLAGAFAFVGASVALRSGALALEAGGGKAFDVRTYGVTPGDVSADQARKNAQAIEQAILDAQAAGEGSVVQLPGGLILVHLDPADYDDARSRYRTSAIRCPASHIVIQGAGEAATTLKNFHDGQDDYSYSVMQLGVPPLDNGNFDNIGLTLRNMTLDGNHFFARPENYRPELKTTSSAIRVEGLKACVFSDLTITNAGGYAMGLQNGGYVDNRFERVTIRNTMADGIDVKDNRGLGQGNVMIGVTVERFGLAANRKDPFAGLDLMGRGWRLDGITVKNWGQEGTPAAGLRFKQGGPNSSRGNGAVGSVAKNVRIIGAPPKPGEKPWPAIGVHVKCEDITIDGLTVRDVAFGVIASQPDLKLSHFDIEAWNAGFVQRDRESREQVFDGADNSVLSDGAIKVTGDKGVGLDLRRPGAVVRSVKFDVPHGAGMAMRRAFPLDQSGATFAAGTQKLLEAPAR